MPKKIIGDVPFPPLIFVDHGGLVTTAEISAILNGRIDGASICLRYPGGPPKRGGYFFHLKAVPGDCSKVSIYDFEKRPVIDLTVADAVAFMNHCSGRKFDQASFDLSQSTLNFLKDEL